MPRYLERRFRRWYAVLDVPSDVRRCIGGGGRRVQSLGTESLTEAMILVLPVIAGWKAEFEEARTGKPIRFKDVMATGMTWRPEIAAAQGERRDILLEVVAETAEEIAWTDPATAEDFHRVVTGKSLPTAHHLDAWIGGLKDAPKTLDEKRRMVRAFAAEFPFTHKVDHKGVRSWVHKMLTKEGVARPTVAKRVSFVRGYWDHLMHLGVVPTEGRPFSDVMPKGSKKTKAAQEDEREPFAPDEVGKLLTAAEAKGDHDLAALIWVAMWTGCRIEELCSLRVGDADDDRIRVRDAKTKAGNRVVPLHVRARPLVARLKERSKDGYVFSGLTFNKYGDRSNAIGKRFGRLKEGLGFGAPHVFHSIRKTVTTLLENAHVPENVTADILGHDKQTITYGVYSGGSGFKVMARAVAKLRYNAQEPGLGVTAKSR